jgi:hypothetical protein
MSPIKRIVRRVRFFRYCAMAHAQSVRKRQREARWAYIQSVLATVGNITIAWAGIERMLDELIAWYQHQATALESNHPRNLSDKIKYLHAMQKDERFKLEIRGFLRTARINTKRLGDERHNLIHGLLHLESGLALTWRTQRVIIKGPNARLEHRTYTNGDLQRISSEISCLGGYLSPRVWAIIGGDPSLMPAQPLADAKCELGLS